MGEKKTKLFFFVLLKGPTGCEKIQQMKKLYSFEKKLQLIFATLVICSERFLALRYFRKLPKLKQKNEIEEVKEVSFLFC